MKKIAFLAILACLPASGQLINCASGFNTSTGNCAVAVVGLGGKAWQLLGSSTAGLNGTQVDLMPTGTPHGGQGLIYQTAVDDQAFTATFTFVPNGDNISFTLNNNTNTDASPAGPDLVSGAGCEGGFYQAFSNNNHSTNDIFALMFDQYGYESASGSFTYSSVQIYQQNQSPCSPNDNGPFYWSTNKFSTSPVPMNSPAGAQGVPLTDTFSATITYDGSNVVLNLYDVTAGGSCPGPACFTKIWSNVSIPSLVGSTTAYVGLTGGVGETSTHPLYVNSFTYAVNTPTATPGTTAPVAGATAAANPTFSPAAGTYTSAQTVSLSTTTPSGYICYAVGASGMVVKPMPDNLGACSVGTLYTSPITVSSSNTVYATAGTSGATCPGSCPAANLPSGIAQAAYVIGSGGTTASTPTFSLAAGTYTGSQSVTISDATSGATIYYTTNGNTPTTSSPVYSGPITVSATETLQAMAAASGDSNSAVAAAAYTITTPVVATPTFSPAAGAYTTAQAVTISDATSGATIYYTTNGSTPTTSSAVFSGPVTVSATETLQAIAVAAGDSNSAVASSSYTISSTAPSVATPTFTPGAGIYSAAQAVTLSDTTAGTTIYYTTNGSTPTTSSTSYSGPITVSASETLQAIAVAAGDSNSAMVSAAYTISSPRVATPAFTPAAGAYTSAQTVTISDSTAGATLYYTTDGTTPTPSSTAYSGPIAVSATETLQAIAVAAGDSNSAVASAAYTISTTPPSVATPTFTPAAGTYNSAQTVSISDATSGAAIYYTTNGTTPTASSTPYTGPVAVGSTETLQAIAVDSGDSAVASAAYTITAQPNFLLTTSVASLTVDPGGQGTVTVTVTPENGFNSPVVLACSGLPAWATCSFDQATVTPSGEAATTQLTISTNTQSSALQQRSRSILPFTVPAMAVCLLGFRRRRRWHQWLVVAVACAGMGLLFGCNATTGATAGNSTTPTVSTVTLTAISGKIQGNAAITITVN